MSDVPTSRKPNPANCAAAVSIPRVPVRSTSESGHTKALNAAAIAAALTDFPADAESTVRIGGNHA